MCNRKIKEERLNGKNNMVKNMMIFRLISDTLTFKITANEQNQYQPTDFALVELRPDKTGIHKDMEFLGWNRTNTPPASGVVLHHPRGEVMKYAKDNTALNIYNDFICK